MGRGKNYTVPRYFIYLDRYILRIYLPSHRLFFLGYLLKKVLLFTIIKFDNLSFDIFATKGKHFNKEIFKKKLRATL